MCYCKFYYCMFPFPMRRIELEYTLIDDMIEKELNKFKITDILNETY